MIAKDLAASHDENRMEICLCCEEKKSDMRTFEPRTVENLKSISDWDETDVRLPKSVYSSCRINMGQNNTFFKNRPHKVDRFFR